MTTRAEIEAKCEELAERRAKRQCSTGNDGFNMAQMFLLKVGFEDGFRAALDLTWPMIEELRKVGNVFVNRYQYDQIEQERNTLKAENKHLRTKALNPLAVVDVDLKAEVERLKGLLGWKRMGAQVSPSHEQYEDLKEEAERLAEALESARRWVVTHSMQPYSQVANKEAIEINEILANYRSKYPKEAE